MRTILAIIGTAVVVGLAGGAVGYLVRKNVAESKIATAEEQAEQAIAKLQHYGLLDEQRYAARVFEGWLNKRSYGRQHLRAELVKRGIRPELVQEVLERFTPELEAQQADNAAALFVQRNQAKIAQAGQAALGPQERALLNKKLYAAAGRFMAARGFSAEYMQVFWEKLQVNTDI